MYREASDEESDDIKASRQEVSIIGHFVYFIQGFGNALVCLHTLCVYCRAYIPSLSCLTSCLFLLRVEVTSKANITIDVE